VSPLSVNRISSTTASSPVGETEGDSLRISFNSSMLEKLLVTRTPSISPSVNGSMLKPSSVASVSRSEKMSPPSPLDSINSRNSSSKPMVMVTSPDVALSMLTSIQTRISHPASKRGSSARRTARRSFVTP
jgi:hypothetical protein